MQEHNFVHRALNKVCFLPWIAHKLAKQLQCPSGIFARWIGNGLAGGNKDINIFAVDLLDIQPTDHVLEIGFGPGVCIGALLEKIDGGNIYGIETSQPMIDMVTKKYADAIENGTLTLSHSTQEKLQLQSNSYNAVLAIHVLYFQKDPVEFLRTIFESLKKGGIVVIGIEPKETNQQYKITQTGVFTLYDPEEIIELLIKIGFQKEDCSVHPCPENPAVCITAKKYI